MSILDDIVNVTISISSPVEEVEVFNNVLLVGAGPTGVGTLTPEPVQFYSKLEDLISYGYADTSPVYVAMNVAFQNGANRVCVAIRQNTSNDSNAVEELAVTLTRALDFGGWYGFVITGTDIETIDNDYVAASTWAESNHRLFGCVMTWDGSSELANPVANKLYSFCFATKSVTGDNADNLYIHLAAMCKCFTHQPGSETWAYKQLASDIVQDKYNRGQVAEILKANMNCYVPCGGKNITLNGITANGEWIDVIRFRDWLLNRMQQRVYNLFIENSKVPYTDAGITLVENQMISVLKEGQLIGGISNDSIDTDGKTVLGFTVSVPSITAIPDSQRALRVLNNCKFTARLAGAIHIVYISGVLTQ